MKKQFYLTIIFVVVTATVMSQQLRISGEIRPRLEARHGYKTLASQDDEAAVFVSQRTRLNLDYVTDNFKVKFTIQNVRVWGDVSTVSLFDKNGIAFHEAFAEYYFNSKFLMKLGRQEIAYDDERIFGEVGWAQGARSHDAFLLKFKTGKKGKLNIGFALNANGESIFKENYLVNQYKNFQYGWYHTDFNENIGLSLLFLNNGMPYDEIVNTNEIDQKIAYSQTIGSRLTYKNNRLNFDTAGYLQTGKTPSISKNDKIDLSAYYFVANIKLIITDKISIGTGIEYFSGIDQGNNNSENNAFNPFYGTNHKYNGLMDYFYVGNHIDNVGLIDIYIPITYNKNKFTASLSSHFFSAEGDILNSDGSMANSYLGTEIDLFAGYKINKSIALSLGYSQMIATKSMEILKSGSKEETNNWAWAMITFKPNFLNNN